MTDAPEQEIDVGAPLYEGHNSAHRKFLGEYKYLNALYYLLYSTKDILRTHLENKIADGDREAPKYGRTQVRALFIVTHPISNTQFKVVTVKRDDAVAMAADFDGFLRTVRIHCINASHRLLVDYIYDLLLEIDATGGMAVLDQDRDALHARSVKPRKIGQIARNGGCPPNDGI